MENRIAGASGYAKAQVSFGGRFKRTRKPRMEENPSPSHVPPKKKTLARRVAIKFLLWGAFLNNLLAGSQLILSSPYCPDPVTRQAVKAKALLEHSLPRLNFVTPGAKGEAPIIVDEKTIDKTEDEAYALLQKSLKTDLSKEELCVVKESMGRQGLRLLTFQFIFAGISGIGVAVAKKQPLMFASATGNWLVAPLVYCFPQSLFVRMLGSLTLPMWLQGWGTLLRNEENARHGKPQKLHEMDFLHDMEALRQTMPLEDRENPAKLLMAYLKQLGGVYVEAGTQHWKLIEAPAATALQTIRNPKKAIKSAAAKAGAPVRWVARKFHPPEQRGSQQSIEAAVPDPATVSLTKEAAIAGFNSSARLSYAQSIPALFMASNPAMVSIWNGVWFLPSFFPTFSNILMALSKKRIGMALTTAASPFVGIFPDDRGCIGLGRLLALPTNLFMIQEAGSRAEQEKSLPATHLDMGKGSDASNPIVNTKLEIGGRLDKHSKEPQN